MNAMGAASGIWIIRGGRLFASLPLFGIMGILNLTPDSFYDGGRYEDAASALARAGRLLAEGADIIDLGAESSRPGAAVVPAVEELSRLLPAIAAIKNAEPEVIISVDCWKVETATNVLEAGADIINDISAALFDPGLMEVLATYKPGYVLMHSQGRPENMQDNPKYDNVVDELLDFFTRRMEALVSAGLPEDRIVIDPGIGFGKTVEHNLRIIGAVERFHVLGRPLLAGVSMKSLFAGILSPGVGTLGEEEKIRATQTATAFLAGKGVALHRVHHVAAARDTLRLTRAFSSYTNPGTC